MKRALRLTVMLFLVCPGGAAQLQPSQADYSKLQVPRTLQRYRASLSIDSSDKGAVSKEAWKDIQQKKGVQKKVSLTPAEGYVRYMLAGSGDVLRFGCVNGFRPVNPEQTPPNPNGFVEDTPNTTGTTLQLGTTNTITYDCVRAPAAPHHKPAAKK